MFRDIQKQMNFIETTTEEIRKLYPNGCVKISCKCCPYEFDDEGNNTVMCAILKHLNGLC